MSEKVQFQTNLPIEVALKYDDGKEVTGQYGDQVLYTLTDGRVMYVPPIVKKKIDELGIGRGELFTITKAEKKNGTRRTIEWVVGANDGGDRKPQTRAQQRNGQVPAQRRGGRIGAGKRKQSQAGFTQRGERLSGDRPGAVPVCRPWQQRWMLRLRPNGMRLACGTELQFTSEDLREIGLTIYTSGAK